MTSIIPASKVCDVISAQTLRRSGYDGLLMFACGHFAFKIIACISFHISYSSVKPATSLLCASEYLRKRTPVKKLRKKKLPIRMKTMKKIDCFTLP